MDTEPVQKTTASVASAEHIRSEIRALREHYAGFLQDHERLTAMESEWLSGDLDDADHETMHRARDKIDAKAFLDSLVTLI